MLLPFLNKDLIEAGCDEAGRGCLAGPVNLCGQPTATNLVQNGATEAQTYLA